MPKISEGTIALQDVCFEEAIYPRLNPSSALIREYAEAMINGADFPPIIVEEETNRLFDGYHRWKAYQKYAEEFALKPSPNGDKPIDLWPTPPVMIPCEFHRVPDGMTPKLYAIGFGKKHGRRNTFDEKERAAQEQWDGFPGTPYTLLCDVLAMGYRTIKKILASREAKFKEERDASVLRLNFLGWSHEEISEALARKWPNADGNSRRTVSTFLAENCSGTFQPKSDLDKGHTPETVAERHNMPSILAWHFKLEGLTDHEKFETLKIPIQPYDVLHFQGCDDRFGIEDYPGRIPGQLVAHVLHWFTKPGDIILDPMAGGGTTPDVCLAMGRHCYAYDINASERIDILPHNIATDGWPERLKKATLIFWDPPYFDKKDDAYPDASISRLPRDAYLAFFAKAFADAKAQVKKGTILAFLMSNWNDAEGKRPGIFLWDYADLLQSGGWTLVEHMQVPLSTQQVHPDIVTRFRAEGRRARLERSLLIARA